MTDKALERGGRAMSRLLKALTRANAVAEVDDVGADGGCVRVYAGAPGEQDVIHHASLDVWACAKQAGCVEPIAGARPGLWRISKTGRDKGQAKGRIAGGGAGSRGRPARSKVMPAPSRANAPMESDCESPLSWLRRRRDKAGEPLINDVQFSAGERLRVDFEIARLMPRVTVDWERAANGGGRAGMGAMHRLELGERALAARERVNQALSAVGPELAGVLVDVCCHLKGLEQLEKAAGWPQRSAKIVLLVGLSALARHYGLEHRAHADGREAHGPARVLHWGASGYRPETTLFPSDDAER